MGEEGNATVQHCGRLVGYECLENHCSYDHRCDHASVME